MLQRLLDLAERIWGGRGSVQTLITGIFFSLVHAWVLFRLGITIDSEERIAAIIGLRGTNAIRIDIRLPAFGGVAVLPFMLVPAFLEAECAICGAA